MNEQAEGFRREGEADGGSGKAEQQTFSEELAQDLSAGGAQRVADGELARAGGGAHQQQAGHVDDGHGDDQQHHAHDDGERGAHILAGGREALSTGLQVEMGPIDEALAR